jgi:hypothetical protein
MGGPSRCAQKVSIPVVSELVDAEKKVSELAQMLGSLGQRATAGIDERQAKVETLQREIKELRAIAQLVQAVEQAVGDGLPATALHALMRAKDARRALEQRSADSARQLEQLERDLHQHVDAQLNDIARAFPGHLEAREIKLDPSSRDPKFTIDRAFIKIYFDKKKRVAILQTRGGRKERLAPDPGPVADRVAAERARLFERDIDLAGFATKIRDAYLAVAQAPGASVPIFDLLAQLRQQDKGLAVDEFTVDLSRLVAGGADTVEAAGMRLEQTRRQEQGLLLPGMESRGYFGYVSFEDKGATHGN